MRENRAKRIRREEHNLAKVRKEGEDSGANSAEQPYDHQTRLRCARIARNLLTEQLRFRFCTQLRWNSADYTRRGPELAEHRANFAHAHGRSFQLLVNEIVIRSTL